jgi:hypothetical protein
MLNSQHSFIKDMSIKNTQFINKIITFDDKYFSCSMGDYLPQMLFSNLRHTERSNFSFLQDILEH